MACRLHSASWANDQDAEPMRDAKEAAIESLRAEIAALLERREHAISVDDQLAISKTLEDRYRQLRDLHATDGDIEFSPPA